MGKRNIGRVRLDSSIRMLIDNPVWKLGIARRIRAKLIGKKFVIRGGNGHLTVPQKSLAKALRLPMEVTIPTGIVFEKFKDIPRKYCVDIAHVQSKTAIEVDGEAHRSHRIKALDEKKTKVLGALGWSVIRITNQKVLENVSVVAKEIRAYIKERKT